MIVERIANVPVSDHRYQEPGTGSSSAGVEAEPFICLIDPAGCKTFAIQSLGATKESDTLECFAKATIIICFIEISKLTEIRPFKTRIVRKDGGVKPPKLLF